MPLSSVPRAPGPASVDTRASDLSNETHSVNGSPAADSPDMSVVFVVDVGTDPGCPSAMMPCALVAFDTAYSCVLAYVTPRRSLSPAPYTIELLYDSALT